MKKKVEINEEVLCKEYLETKIGVESLALKYHIGKLRVKEILKKNNIEIKKRGAQSNNEIFIVNDFKIKKYVNSDNTHFIVIDRKNPLFCSKDIDNRGGVLTSYIESEYGVKTPTLYDRRMYYMRTGNYWWEQWLTYQEVENQSTLKCPYCEWETTDITNKSGTFEQHLLKCHNITPKDYISKHSNTSNLFKNYKRDILRKTEMDEYVICPLCNQKYKYLTEAHMRHFHGISLHQFREKYPNYEIMTQSLRETNIQNYAKSNLVVSKNRFVSKYEHEIQEFLKNKNIKFDCNRQILIGKEIDILVEEKKIGIEFDGLKFHTEFFGHKSHTYHLDKTLKCNEKGYGLIHIFEDEFVKHKEIVFSKISHILGLNRDLPKIYARDKRCKIRDIYSNDAKIFLNENHIQGFAPSTVYLGAFYDNILIAVMSFKNGNIKNKGWELTRFATDIKYQCVGLGGKLFKHFIKTYSPTSIISFADRRWTVDINNNLYTKLNFKIEKIGRPDYRYYNERVDKYTRYHKMSFNKQSLSKKYGYPITMTELEITKDLGYDRIWDCGLIKYVYKKEDAD